MKLLYNAGNLFNEAEVAQRKKEGIILSEKLPEIEVYNPIDAPINDKTKLPSAEEVFNGDYIQVKKSNYIIADLTNNDVGTAMELGSAITINEIFRILKANGEEGAISSLIEKGFNYKDYIIGVSSDIRQITANQYEGCRVPYGLNQYMIGGILNEWTGEIVNNFNEAVDLIKNKIR